MPLQRIEDKIDKIVDQIGSINATLAAQHVSLDTHIKRTDLLEAEIKPIKSHVNMISGALKLIGLIATLSGIGAFALTVLNHIGK